MRGTMPKKCLRTSVVTVSLLLPAAWCPAREPTLPWKEAGLTERAGLRARAGFVFDEDFLFRADTHDAGTKKVLGRTLPAGRGIEDGLDTLAILAAHPSTARHLAAKIAARFVADEPPASLSGGTWERVRTTSRS